MTILAAAIMTEMAFFIFKNWYNIQTRETLSPISFMHEYNVKQKLLKTREMSYSMPCQRHL